MRAVSFIAKLPTGLVAAFRATLEELEGADLLLHALDVSSARRERTQVVRSVAWRAERRSTDPDHPEQG